jgi:hypothetical protein
MDMNPAESHGRADLPVLVVIHPVATTRHQIKTALTAGHHTAAICVESADDALHLLADGINGLAAILLPWPLPDDGVQHFLDGLNILAPKPRPAVLVHGTGYGPHDLSDMSECGATALIDTPPRLDEVVRELVSLRQTGTSPGRTRLVTGAVARPVGQARRVTKDPNWRDRMVRLATTTRSRSAEFRRNRLIALLGRLDELAGGRVSMAYIEALLLMARNDARQVESLIRADNLNRDLIDQFFAIVEERMQFPGGQPAPRAVIVHALEELVEIARLRRRGDNWTANYSDLKAGATDILLGRLSLEAANAQGYRDRLCAWLGLENGFLVGVDNDRLRRIAARVVKDPDEGTAMDFARLSLLAHLLKIERIRLGTFEPKFDPANLNTLSSLLGDAEMAANLKRRAGAMGKSGANPDDVPPFGEFTSLFSVIEGAAAQADFDPKALDCLRASLCTVADLPVPAPGARLPAPPKPSTTPAPTGGATPAPAPLAGSPGKPEAGARLLPRLAQELGLSAGFFNQVDESALLTRLDRRPLMDVQLPPAALARLRVIAVLLTAEETMRRALLQTAIVTSYESQPESLDALMQILARAGAPAVTAGMRKAVGLLATVSPPREVLQIMEADDPILTWFALRDLPDNAPETPGILAAAVKQFRDREPAMPVLTPVIGAVLRRLARIGVVSAPAA